MEFEITKVDGIKEARFFYLVERIKLCTQRTAVLGWFTAVYRPMLNIDHAITSKRPDFIKVTDVPEVISQIVEHPTLHIPKTELKTLKQLESTDPLQHWMVYGTIPVNDTTVELVKLSEDSAEPPFRLIDEFHITGGMIENYKGGDMLTDVGKFYLNQLLLVDPFGDKIPYINDIFVPSKLDTLVAKLIVNKQAGRKEFNKYINNGYWFGEDGSICTQGLSEKALGTDPRIAKRKEELLKQYKDNLHDPLVVTKIEKELIEMDKAYLKGDSSEPFYMAAGKKAFNEQRKKMFIMFGLSSDFTKSGAGTVFTQPSLEDGFTPENLPNIANEVRRGSYGRGIKTAEGGAESKFILRVFQNTKIIEDDCGSKKGIHITLTNENKNKFLGRYLVDGTCLTTESIDKYVGKKVEMRSMLHCHTKGGYCYKCCGNIFKELKLTNIGMQSLSLAEGFIGIAMASMHTSGLSTTTLGDITKYIRYKN